MAADSARTAAAGALMIVFVVAFAVLIGVQLALMSILDQTQVEEAARTVSESAFAAELVDDAVREAVTPLAGEQVAAEIAQQASTDPDVAEVLQEGLVDAHRAIVDPDAVTETGSGRVEDVLGDVIARAETETGTNLDGVRQQLEVPRVDSRYVPDAGARPTAETLRTLAALVALGAAAVVVVVHPRRGRALAGIGTRTAIVSGIWGIGLLVVGWLIGQAADTLFGRLVQDLWSTAAPSMLLLVGAGLVIGVALAFGGMSIDGLTRPAKQTRW